MNQQSFHKDLLQYDVSVKVLNKKSCQNNKTFTNCHFSLLPMIDTLKIFFLLHDSQMFNLSPESKLKKHLSESDDNKSLNMVTKDTDSQQNNKPMNWTAALHWWHSSNIIVPDRTSFWDLSLRRPCRSYWTDTLYSQPELSLGLWDRGERREKNPVGTFCPLHCSTDRLVWRHTDSLLKMQQSSQLRLWVSCDFSITWRRDDLWPIKKQCAGHDD